MTRFVVRRLLGVVPILVGVALIAFSMLHLSPGDPIAVLVSNYDTNLAPEVLHELREQHGLNDPLPVQFLGFLRGAVQGDLGRSIFTDRPVTEMIARAAPYTARLAFSALAISIMLGLALGIVAAVKHGTWVDNASIGLSLFGLSMPQFWFGMMAVLVFAVHLGWFPSSGAGTLNHLVLPAAVLGIRSSASIARLTRSAMLEVLGEQYIVTARAKGMRELFVVTRHALKNAFIPVLTLMGLQAGFLLGGAVVIESIFNRQGVGTLMLTAITRNDFPLLQGTTMFLAAVYVIINLLVDVSYAALDPRIRH